MLRFWVSNTAAGQLQLAGARLPAGIGFARWTVRLQWAESGSWQRRW